VKPSRVRLFVFALIAVLGFFFCLEVFLRSAIPGFRYQRGLGYMQFGYPDTEELHHIFYEDPELLFRMRPGIDFGEGFEPLNQRGFRGPDFETKKGKGVFRIVCLGDSVTFGREDADYPEILSQRLKELNPSQEYEVLNLGVPGYSSWQGKRLLERKVLGLGPDLIVWFFGWNDHWLAHGFPDSEQVPDSSVVYQLRDMLQKFRTYQALNLVVVKMSARDKRDRQSRRFRVPLAEYKDILEAVVRGCRDQGIPAILVTAPAGFGLGPLPDFFVPLGFIDEGQNLKELHAGYNQAVRDAAKGDGVSLVDAQLLFEKEGVKNFFDYPDKDIIHPNRRGFELLAEAILDEMKAGGWVSGLVQGGKEDAR
jgi:lysophospholipase L1-like esterase